MKSTIIKISTKILLALAIISLSILSCDKKEEIPDVVIPNSGIMYLTPYNFKLEEVSISKKELSWRFDFSAIKGFKIDRKVGADDWQVAYLKVAKDALSVVDTMVLPNPNIRYQYKVYAYDDYGPSSYMLIDTVFFVPAPSNVDIRKMNEMTNKITWTDKIKGEEGFKIDRKIGEEAWENELAILPSNTIEYSDELSSKSLDIEYRIYTFYKDIKSDLVNISEGNSLDAASHFSVQFPTLNKIQLSWTDRSDFEDGYKIDRKVGNEAWELDKYMVEENTTSLLITDFPLNEDIGFRIHAYNDVLTSDKKEVSINTDIPTPTEFTISFPTLTELHLNWNDNSEGEHGFKIDRKVGNNNWEMEKYTSGENTTSLLITDFPLNEEIEFRIYAYHETSKSLTKEVSIDTHISSATNFSVILTSYTELNLTWIDNSTGEQGFKIDRKVGDEEWENGKYILAENSTSLQINEFPLNEVIKFRIYAYHETDVSPSKEKSVNTILPAPEDMDITIHSLQEIEINWSDNSDGEHGFKIDRKVGSNGTWEIAKYTVNENIENLVLNDFPLYETLRYRVYAFINDDESEDISDYVKVKIPKPTNMELEISNGSTVHITWDDNSIGEQGFVIDRKIEESGNWENDYAILDENTTSFSDEGLEVYSTVYYNIRAYYDIHTSPTLSGHTQVWECAVHPFIDDRDGKVYNTVVIGEQCWMTENMNIGVKVTSDQTNNGIIEKYCYSNNTQYCNIYGGLYEWGETFNYNSNNSQGICPIGWHIPSTTETRTLITTVGGNNSGGALKEEGYSHWSSPNTGATNSSGFTALPGGVYYKPSDDYEDRMERGYWWLSNGFYDGLILEHNSTEIEITSYGNNGHGNYAQSIRCIRD